MRRWVLGLAATLVVLPACNKQEAATDEASEAPKAADEKAEAGPEAAHADEAGEAPEAADEKADDAVASKPGKGLAATVDAAMKARAEIKGLDMIPAAAVAVGGVDVAALVEHPAWAKLKTRLPSREAGFMEAGGKCGVGTETWVSFVIGTDPATRNMAMVATARGLGKKETLRCLAADLGFALGPDAKTMSDHTGGGVVLDDDSIAFATTDWMPRLDDLVAKKGTKAVDGPLREVLARTDQTKTLWFAGTVPEDVQVMARMAFEASIHDVTGWADLGAGLKVQLSLRVDDAKAVHERLDSQWQMTKGLVTSSGVPRGVTDSLKFSREDGIVTAELAATEDEVRTLTDAVMTAMGI